MVLFLLFIQAELENVGSLSLDKSARFSISARNPLNDFETRSKVVIDPSELLEALEPPSVVLLQKRPVAVLLPPDRPHYVLAPVQGGSDAVAPKESVLERV